jgi:hypothetical protein
MGSSRFFLGRTPASIKSFAEAAAESLVSTVVGRPGGNIQPGNSAVWRREDQLGNTIPVRNGGGGRITEHGKTLL